MNHLFDFIYLGILVKLFNFISWGNNDDDKLQLKKYNKSWLTKKV